MKGNLLALRTGVQSQTLEHVLREERERFLAASVTDDGGAAEVPERRRSLHEYRARLHTHIGQVSDAISRHGVFDRRGRLRIAWLQRLEGLIGTARGIDQTLGLERRTRRVASLSEALLAEPEAGEGGAR